MHCMSIAKKLIEEVETECKKKGMESCSGVVVELGKMYPKSEMEMCFELIKKDSKMLGSAKLTVNEIDSVLMCNECSQETTTEDHHHIICSYCGSTDVEMVSGESMRIVSIEK